MDTTKVRVNTTIPKHIVDFLDEQSEIYGSSRSTMISMIIKKYMDEQKVLQLTDLSEHMEQIKTEIENMKKDMSNRD